MSVRKRKARKGAPSAAEAHQAIEGCLKRLRCGKDAPYFRQLLESMVLHGAVPVDLLKILPVPAQEAGRTRFDQLFEAAMALAFPEYRTETLKRFLGPDAGKIRPSEDKIWRILFPDKYGLAHVLMRAGSYQQAFALACDYACRASLRAYGRVPADLTIRIMFVGERALRRILDMRWAAKTHKQQQLKLLGREFTPRMMKGARLAALGNPRNPLHSVARYAEMKDLVKVRAKGLDRSSPVESESFKRRR